MKQIAIIGNVGQDAVVKVQNNEEHVRFTVAVNDRRKNAQGEVLEETSWFTVFTRQRALAPYLLKGTQVFVQGNIRMGIYQDNSGAVNLDLTIAAGVIQLLGSKKENTAIPQPTAAAPAPPQRSHPAPATASKPAPASRLRPTPPLEMVARPEDDDLPF